MQVEAAKQVYVCPGSSREELSEERGIDNVAVKGGFALMISHHLDSADPSCNNAVFRV